jgi:hypothetical protein
MKKRDAAYYQRRLKAEHPLIYADLKAGRISSTRQAAAKAGLIHLPTRLLGLRREWKGATNKERREFLEWLKSGSAPGVKGKAPTAPLLDAGGYLSRSAADRVWELKRSLRLKKGQMYVQMGLKAHDWRVIRVLQHEDVPPLDVLEAIRAWLAKHPVN